MRHEDESTETSRRYATAYAAHYSRRDLPCALRLYQGLVASHPSAVEADYSRMQIQNIVNSVVPKSELLDAQMQLLLACFRRDRPTGSALAATLPT